MTTLVAMTYASASRPFYDADSHIMELPNFLIECGARPVLCGELLKIFPDARVD